MRGGTVVAPFLSARFGGLSDGGGVVDGCGRGCAGGRGWCHPHVSSFSYLSYRIRRMRLRLLVSFLCLVLASCLFRLGVRLVGTSRFLSCECLAMTSRRGGGGGSVGVLFPSCDEGVLFPHCDWLGGERGWARDDEGAPFYPARFLLFTVSALMFATVIASMMRMREGETIGNDNGENETRGGGKTD